MMSRASWMVMSFTASVTRPPTFFPGTMLKSPCSARNLSTARVSICRRSSEIFLDRPGRGAGFGGPASLCDSAPAGGLVRTLMAGWAPVSPGAGSDSDVSGSDAVTSPASAKLTTVRLEKIVFRISIAQDHSIPEDGFDPNLVDGLPLFEEQGFPLGRVFDHGDRDASPRDAHQLQGLRPLPQDLERRRLGRRFRWLRRPHGLRLCLWLLALRRSPGTEEVPRVDLSQIVFHGPQRRQRRLPLGRGPGLPRLADEVHRPGSDSLRIGRDRRIDFVPGRYHQSLQGIVTQGRDPPGRALRMPVNLPDGVRRKEIPARDVPSLPETERDHRLGVRFVERIDDALEADAVPEVLHLSDPWQELHLPHQDELEELIFVGLIVEEGPQELQQGRTQPLGFVDQQHDRPIVLHALLEEVSLEDLEGSDDGQRT